MTKLYLIPLVFIVFACNSMKNNAESKPLKSSLFTTLISSDYQGRDTESNVIIDNQKALNTLFQSVGNEEVPKVDFAKNQVVALFLGMKKTGGYSISIDKIQEIDGKLILYKKVNRPKSDEMVTMALTNPFVIAEIHSKKEIIFR